MSDYQPQTEFEAAVLAKFDEARSERERIEAKVDAVSDQVQEVARVVGELGGNIVDDPPEEAFG